MADFPSWRECKDGTILFLTDKDAIANNIDFFDACGHIAISKLYPKSTGKDKCGFHDCPDEIWEAIYSGKCNQMISNSSNLDFRDCDIRSLKFPYEIKWNIDLRNCQFEGAILPNVVGCCINLSGCRLKGFTLPEIVRGSIFFEECDMAGVTLPKKVRGIVSIKKCKNYKHLLKLKGYNFRTE